MNEQIVITGDAAGALKAYNDVEAAAKKVGKTLEKLQDEMLLAIKEGDAAKEAALKDDIQRQSVGLAAMKNISSEHLAFVTKDIAKRKNKETEFNEQRLKDARSLIKKLQRDFDSLTLDPKFRGAAFEKFQKLTQTLFAGSGDFKQNMASIIQAFRALQGGKMPTLAVDNKTLNAALPHIRGLFDLQEKSAQLEKQKLDTLKKQTAEQDKQRQRFQGAQALGKQFSANIPASASDAERSLYGKKVNAITDTVAKGQYNENTVRKFYADYMGQRNLQDTKAGRHLFGLFAGMDSAGMKLGAGSDKTAAAVAAQQIASGHVASSNTWAERQAGAMGKTGVYVTRDEQAKLNQAIGGVQKLMSAGKLTEKEFDTMWESFRKGELKAITSAEKDVERLLVKLADAQSKLGTAHAKYESLANKQLTAKQAEDAHEARTSQASAEISKLRGALMPKDFSASTKIGQKNVPIISANEVAAVNTAMNSLHKTMVNSGLDFVRMEQLAKDWEAGTDSSTNQVEATFLSSFQRVRKAHKNMGNAMAQEQKAYHNKQLSELQSASSRYESNLKRTVTATLANGTLARLFLIQNIHMVLGRATSAIFTMTTKLRELEIWVARIRTISDEAQLSTARWTDGLIKLANAIGIDELDLAKATYEAISNQVAKGADALILAGKAAIFARTTGASAADAMSLVSSAMMSFGISNKEADKVFSELFSTIDVGRFTVEELANAYGRVAPLAGQLGIKTSELNSTFALLSQKGVRATEVATQMSGIMSKVLHPTKALKEEILSLGFASGPAMVKTLGWIETLRTLNDSASESGDRLSELSQYFNEIRGFRGITIFNKEGIADLEKVSNEIANSGNRYANAQTEVMNTLTVKLDQKFGQLRTRFYTTVLRPVLEDVNDIIDAAGSGISIIDTIRAAVGQIHLKEILTNLDNISGYVRLIGDLAKSPIVETYALYKALRFVQAAAMDYHQQQRVWAAVRKVEQTDEAARLKMVELGFKGVGFAGAAAEAAISFGATIVIGLLVEQFAAMRLAQEQEEQAANDTRKTMQDFYKATISERQKAETVFKDLDQQRIDTTRNMVDTNTKTYQKFLNLAVQMSNGLVETDKESLSLRGRLFKNYISDVERGFKKATDSMTNNINDLTNAIERMIDELDKSKEATAQRHFKNSYDNALGIDQKRSLTADYVHKSVGEADSLMRQAASAKDPKTRQRLLSRADDLYGNATQARETLKSDDPMNRKTYDKNIDNIAKHREAALSGSAAKMLDILAISEKQVKVDEVQTQKREEALEFLKSFKAEAEDLKDWQEKQADFMKNLQILKTLVPSTGMSELMKQVGPVMKQMDALGRSLYIKQQTGQISNALVQREQDLNTNATKLGEQQAIAKTAHDQAIKDVTEKVFDTLKGTSTTIGDIHYAAASKDDYNSKRRQLAARYGVSEARVTSGADASGAVLRVSTADAIEAAKERMRIFNSKNSDVSKQREFAMQQLRTLRYNAPVGNETTFMQSAKVLKDVFDQIVKSEAVYQKNVDALNGLRNALEKDTQDFLKTYSDSYTKSSDRMVEALDNLATTLGGKPSQGNSVKERLSNFTAPQVRSAAPSVTTGNNNSVNVTIGSMNVTPQAGQTVGQAGVVELAQQLKRAGQRGFN